MMLRVSSVNLERRSGFAAKFRRWAVLEIEIPKEAEFIRRRIQCGVRRV